MSARRMPAVAGDSGCLAARRACAGTGTRVAPLVGPSRAPLRGSLRSALTGCPSPPACAAHTGSEGCATRNPRLSREFSRPRPPTQASERPPRTRHATPASLARRTTALPSEAIHPTHGNSRSSIFACQDATSEYKRPHHAGACGCERVSHRGALHPLTPHKAVRKLGGTRLRHTMRGGGI